MPTTAMTTTELRLAEWESDYLTDGILPYPRSDSIRDPGYVLARIRYALEMADQHGAECDSRESGGLMLRLLVERLGGDLKNFTDAGEEFLAMLRASHPEMRWVYASGGGFIGMPPHDRRNEDAEMQAIAGRCALQLRLNKAKAQPANGGRRWKGEVDGWYLAVVDR